MKKKYVVGVDLGGTKIYTALVDLEGNIIKEKTVETLAFEGENAVMGRIIDAINYVIDGTETGNHTHQHRQLQFFRECIIENSNLPFKNFEIVKTIREAYDLPTYLDNDANVATLGEFMFGAGKGTENMVFITASTGIGGGAVINGKLFRGTTGNALEVGHTIVANEGPRCGCGNIGCAEALGSGTAIGKRAKEAVATNVETSLKNYENVTSKEVFKEAANGDRVAKNILETSLNYLGIAVANTITNFDPEKVVIGGGVINGGSIVLDTIRRVVGERALKTFADSCTVEKAVLGGKAGVLGAAALAITEQ